MTARTIQPKRFSARYSPREITELARSAQGALDSIPRTWFRTFRATASGTAGTPLPDILVSNEGVRPVSVVLERVQLASAPTEDVGDVTPRPNFGLTSAGNEVYVTLYEPDGLTANAAYDLTVRVCAVGG